MSNPNAATIIVTPEMIGRLVRSGWRLEMAVSQPWALYHRAVRIAEFATRELAWAHAWKLASAA